MIIGVFLNHILDALGVYLIIATTIKITRGHPVRRWFY
jgi:hypothetical protein